MGRIDSLFGANRLTFRGETTRGEMTRCKQVSGAKRPGANRSSGRNDPDSTQRPRVRQNPTSCLTQCQTEKKSFCQLCVIFTKTAWCTTLHGENAVNFLCTPKWRVRDCTPKNLDVPPKMKVKGYMYLQMKKPVGMLSLRWRYRFICSHYRWIWLPCAVRSLCGQCPFVGAGPTLYLNSRTARALRRNRLFLWIFGCNVWGSFWWIQGWNLLYYRFYWYMLTILSFYWW